MSRLHRKISARWLLLLFALILTGASSVSHAQATITQNVGVAGYFYNSSYWTTVQNTVPKGGFAVVNPSSGPGTSPDSNWANWINNVHGAGIRVIGYVDTGYFGTNTIGAQRLTRLRQGDMQSWENQIEQDVDQFYNFYSQAGLDGIFFDDGQNVCGQNNIIAQYYTEIYNYVKKNHPGAFVVMNPGTSVSLCLENTADTLLDFEGTYLCYVQDSSCPQSEWYTPEAWSTTDPNKYYHIIHDIPPGNTTDLANVMALSKQRNVGYVYALDASGGDPYAVLPSFLNTEVAELAGTPDNTQPTIPDTVDTENIGENWAILNWGPSTDWHGTGVVAYDVYQVINGKNEYVASVPASNNPQVTLPLLNPGAPYTYSVQARSAAGIVGLFGTVSFTTEPNDGDLCPPTNVTAAQINYSDVVVSWTAAHTNEYPVAYYDITVTNLYTGVTNLFTAPTQPSTGPAVLTITTDASVTSADISGLLPGSTYQVQVSARDNHGTVTSAAPFNVTTKTLPGGSGVTNATASYSSSTGVTVQATYLLPYANHEVFIDAGDSSSTGYITGNQTPQLGADWMLDDTDAWYFTGPNGQTWGWQGITPAIAPSVSGTAAAGWTYTWNVPLSALVGGVPLGNTIVIGVSGSYPLNWASQQLTLTEQ